MNNTKIRSVLTIFVVLLALPIFTTQNRIASVKASTSPQVDKTVNLVLTVDPNGWITIEGMAKDTTTTTSPANFTVYGDLSILDNEAAANITLLVPAENATKFPFNSPVISWLMDYAGGLAHTNLALTVTLPPKQVLSEYITDVGSLEMIEYFLNSTDYSLNAEYLDGDIAFSVEHTMVANLTELLSSLIGMPLGLEAPFILDLNCSKGEYDGSIRFILLPGLPIEDFEIDITGNLTDICFNGDIQITYGTYPSMGEINQTFVDNIEYFAENVFNSSIDVQGSLLNMSRGWLECSKINVDRELLGEGEDVTFEVCIREARSGAFIYFPLTPLRPYFPPVPLLPPFYPIIFPFILNDTLNQIQDTEIEVVYTPTDTKLDVSMSGTIHIIDLMKQLLEPKTVPEEWPESIRFSELNSTNFSIIWFAMKILNATTYSFENSSLNIAYSHSERKAEVTLTSYTDVETLDEDLSKLMLELPPGLKMYMGLPPNYAELVEPLLTTELADITDLQANMTYENGKANLITTLSLEGDINAETNYIKNVVISYMKTVPATLPWQFLYINETNIDITGMNCYIKMDNVSTEGEMKELAVQPPSDPIDATTFKLDRFFNMTTDLMFPAQGEQLNVTVIGGSNATHKVTLYNATGVPEPDLVSLDADDRPILMTWNNITLSDLRELQFIIVDLPPLAVTLSTPTSADINENSVTLSWTKSEDHDFARYEIFQSTSADTLGISIANITDKEQLSYEATDLTSGTTYYFTVRVVDGVGLCTDSNQASVKTTQPIWTQSWFIPTIVGAIAILIAALFFFTRRKTPQVGTTSQRMA